MRATQIRLARRPEGEPTDQCYAITHDEVPDPADGQLLLRVVYLSLDPYMRGRMSDAESYAAPTRIGDVMAGGTVCEVVASRHPDFSEGDLVLSYSG
jgi:NADPH-dependent curcumin reductase CurA